MRRSFERQLRGFVECVRSGTAPRASVADGIAVLRAVEAARTSAATDGAEAALEGAHILDLAPTAYELLGVPQPPEMRGRAIVLSGVEARSEAVRST